MNIEKMTVEDIRKGYREKKFTVKEVTKACFSRIKSLDSRINAFISLSEESALEEAEKTDKKINAGEDAGMLGGIPIAIKDLICTRGIKTTCASKMLENFIPPYDAAVVRKLKEAGAVIIGKTNMDEFAMGSSTENSAFKITKNPWDLERVPGGSSGGSAAAVSAGFVPLAVGSDTGGSIRQPAAFCGNVGIKPTYGLVSRFGLIAFASSLDQIGPFARTVKDCAAALQVMRGKDYMDGTSAEGCSAADYVIHIDKGIKGFKIGVPKEFLLEGPDPEIKGAIQRSVELFEEMGAEIEEFSLPVADSGLSAYYIMSSAEASSNLARYDGVRYGYRTKNYENFEELIVRSRSEAFGKEVKRRIMLGTYVLSSGYYDAYYKKAMLMRKKIKQIFSDAFKKYDIIVSPVSPFLPFKIGEKTEDPLQMYLADVYTVSVNIAGLPAISVPCGFSRSGLPIGMQIIGDRYAEQKLFQAAYSLEQELGISNMVPDLREVERRDV